jgi:hypothetical protein
MRATLPTFNPIVQLFNELWQNHLKG